MTITPDHADQWAQEATDGPWYVHTDTDGTLIHDDTGNMCIAVESTGSAYLAADLTLAAAAPGLAHTIAGMRYEYRIEEWGGNYWYPCAEWDGDESLFDGYTARKGERLVRRLVGPVEVVE